MTTVHDYLRQELIVPNEYGVIEIQASELVRLMKNYAVSYSASQEEVLRGFRKFLIKEGIDPQFDDVDIEMFSLLKSS